MQIIYFISQKDARKDIQLETAGVQLWKTAVLSMLRANYPIGNQDFL